ncbi:hypothetical protein CROQUDRAFT_664708 [Cronartium quercuum f. sp. fusiforme G11]|uniref:Uncharacterized protein n=1 Tax=Cronartium quercuum f. sp. fusiforme G11 TaxID=708437 RepID=A0A9P6N714_9BASI|nr:hypothetical protein CROQUDRAFT_664708 [Cronartium quercuum f. sp. fusiforme G11]
MVAINQTSQPKATQSMSPTLVLDSRSNQESENENTAKPTGWVGSQLLRLRGGGHHPIAECCCCICICIGIEEFCCIEALNSCLGN